MTLRHYLYVSEPKINSLFEQLDPGVIKRSAVNLKIDLKLVSAEWKSSPSADSTSARLKIVLDRLRRDEAVGSVRDSRPYIAGRLTMRYGVVHPGMLAFAAKISRRRTVILCGSQHHLVGEKRLDAGVGYSSLLQMYLLLKERIDRKDEDEGDSRGRRPGSGPDEHHKAVVNESLRRLQDPISVTTSFGHVAELMDQYGITAELEFVARRLADGPGWSNGTVLVGTPLYVALAD
jgi:hypothetical protein